MKLGDYYYKRYNDFKAILYFKKWMRISTRYKFDEVVLYRIVKSYLYIWDLKQALNNINQAIEYSPWYFEWIELKWKILKDLWKEEESLECFNKIKQMKKQIENTKLDLDKFYNGKSLK